MGNECPKSCCQAELSRSENNVHIASIVEEKKKYSKKENESSSKKSKNASKNCNFQEMNEESRIHRIESISRKSSPFEIFNDKYSSREINSRTRTITKTTTPMRDKDSEKASSSVKENLK